MSRVKSCTFAIAVCLLALPAVALADTFTGTLNIIWGDPKDRSLSQGAIHYILATPDGRYVPLQVTSDANTMLAFSGKAVVINGQQAAAQPRTTGAGGANPSPIVVESIELDRSASALARDTEPKVSGTRKVLFLLLKFADDAALADPHPSTFFDSLTNPDLPSGSIPATINGFFKKTSNNLFSWVGDVGGVGGISAPGGPARAWITLPQTKSFYAPCGFSSSCFNFGTFNTDAVNAATAQGIVLTPYDNINFVISNDLDCCAYGSPAQTLNGKTFGVTWEPPWGQETRVYSHEMGHSLGLPHSGWVYHAYDSPWDVMSDYSDLLVQACGSYFSRNDNATENIYCREPGNGYIMPHRDRLGWIAPANQTTVPIFGSKNVMLEGGSVAVGAGLKMIKICIPGFLCTGTGSTTRYFTVEARVKGGGSTTLFDNGIPNQGVIIHDVWFGRPSIGGACFFNSQSGWAVPVDATPGDWTGSPTCSGAGLINAQFTPGMTYTNNTYNFKVTIGARVGNTFNVIVKSTLTYPTGDFDGDVKADMTLYRGDGQWSILKSTSGYTSSQVITWGGPGYVPVYGDYDGDGRQDPAVYQQSTGQWLALLSSSNYTTTFGQAWGGPQYIPEPGDYDGDGKADLAVYVESTANWLILKSSTGFTSTINVFWGGVGYTPVPGRDFDGDGKADIAAYRESTGTWHVLKSSTNFTAALNVPWGGRGYTLVPGDYDGDSKADLGLYQRATGNWYVLLSSVNYTTTLNIPWGGLAYEPVPGDYDGDGRTDLGLVNRAAGTWLVLNSNAGYTTSFSVAWNPSVNMVIPGAIRVGRDDTRRATDYDGDGKADLTVYNASAATGYSLLSGANYTTAANRAWGGAGFTVVPGDFDGDGQVDYGTYQSSTGNWSVLLSGAGFTTTITKNLGNSTSAPAVGDYDGDGKSDIAVYNGTTAQWAVLYSSQNFTAGVSAFWGGSGYKAVPGDYDGDGKTDMGVYQPSTGNWNILLAAANFTTAMNMAVGGPAWDPVPGDFDGDGKTDFVVYNNTTGQWYGLKSSTSYTTTVNVFWGGPGYTPVQGDYDGDGKVDLALDTTAGAWSILLSSSNYTTTIGKSWGGGASYVPVPRYP